MEGNKDLIELLDLLYAMVTDAWGVPLGNDKCIIERDKAIELINDIKASLPSSVAEAQRLVAARDEFIGNAKREAEALRKSAEEQARAMIEEQEIVRVARAKSMEMLTTAETKSKELKRSASLYVDQLIGKAVDDLNRALADVKGTQNSLNSVNAAARQTEEEAEQPIQPQPIAREPAQRHRSSKIQIQPRPMDDEDELTYTM